MRATEFITEAKVSIRDQILADVKKNGPGHYFVRFTGIDKLGYSAKQWFGKTPDADDPNFDVDYIGHGKGRPVLWFYPLETYLDQKRTVYASEQPYAWLVKLKPNAWLQPIKRGEKGVKPAPQGKERVGIMRMSQPPAALFFKHGYDLIGKYYDYGGQHKRHGEVKGPEVNKPSFFDRVRGYT
jgi:hypothetical protein